MQVAIIESHAKSIFFLVVVGALAAAAPPTDLMAKPPRGSTVNYEIIQLSNRLGMVRAINSSGEMVGFLEVGGIQTATNWQLTSSGVAESKLSLSFFEGDDHSLRSGSADGINDQGIIVGTIEDASTGYVEILPVCWINRTSLPQILSYDPSIPAEMYVRGSAFSVCNTPSLAAGLKAVIVGHYVEYPEGAIENKPAITHAVAWAISDSGSIALPLELAVFPSVAGNEYRTVAIDINARLTVVGSVGDQAVRWQLSWNGNSLTVISTTVLFPNLSWSNSRAINENGDICGERANYSTPYLLKSVNGALVEQTLTTPSFSGSEYYKPYGARALNDLATPQVVGASSVFDSRSKILNRTVELLWQGTMVYDLERVTPSNTIEPDYMTSVNNQGWLAGQGWVSAQALRVPVVLKRQ
jgi:hypothetical protein